MLQHDLLHGNITRVLPHLILIILVLTTVSFVRDLTRIKIAHLCIIEAEPVVIDFPLISCLCAFGCHIVSTHNIASLSILDERVVMPRITSSIMDDNAHEFIVEILVSDYFVKNDLLILIEVFLSPVLLLHLFNQVLSCHVLLTVRSHVQVHWEGAVVIKLDLLH